VNRIPYPTTYAGLTPDDIPYGYSAFNTLWDDGRGYEPAVVGHEVDDAGRLVILLALSPGQYLRTTMVSAGQAPEQAGKALLEALARRADEDATAVQTGPTAGQGPPNQVVSTREARQ